MSPSLDPAARAEALTWVIRTRDPDFADWDQLTAWLEADATHPIAYADTQCWDQELADDLPLLASGAVGTAAALPTVRAPRRLWLPLAAAIVALAGGGATWLAIHPAEAPAPGVTVATRAAERRILALADGTRIALAPGSRLTLDPGGRRARIASGQAFFTVHHDAVRPFEVDVGTTKVTDLGTAFDVRAQGGSVLVAVAQGSVSVSASGASVSLRTGQTVLLRSDEASVGRIDPAMVGQWRSGLYTYSDATVGDVLADLARVSGARIAAPNEVRRRPFAGTVRLGAARPTFEALAPALGCVATAKDGGWQLHALASRGG